MASGPPKPWIRNAFIDVVPPLPGPARSDRRQLQPLLHRDLAELLVGPGLDLADPFLGHAQLLAELLQGLLDGPLQPEPAGEDPALAVVQVAEHALDRLSRPTLGDLVF